ncbi:hypothetical protein DLAC_09616 [Tieghemostelium lacteum]|uniref:Uncharacterized protein n=1 Tax=Tieghemostelium lacteum TaxID=361077 RepID=A0A151Z6R3_TIELA|nr:hypothetical protein DLAC_09616 [Tieghemostelium lacteum]|eukprot:KYQ89650.1 hypothetical protein DLAC_09616 [Tieghemostelium lacteum]
MSNHNDHFQILFNNSFIRLKILNGIDRVIDLLRLMFTSNQNRKLIQSSIDKMSITIKQRDIIKGTLEQIIKNLSNVHTLDIHLPSIESLYQLKSVNTLIIRRFPEIKQNKEQLFTHLSKVVKDELRICNSNVDINIGGIDRLIKQLFLDTLPTRYTFESFDQITTLRQNPLKSLYPHCVSIISQKHFPLLQNIILNGDQITDQILQNLSKSAQLRNVKLYRCSQVTDVGMVAFRDTVTKLDVDDLPEITDLALQYPHLKYLKIQHCPKVVGHCFEWLSNTLENIDIGNSIIYLKPVNNYDSYKYFRKIPNVTINLREGNVSNTWDKENEYSHLALLTHFKTFPTSQMLTDDILSNLTRVKVLYFGSYGGRNHTFSDIGIQRMIENRYPKENNPIESIILDSFLVTDKSLEYLSTIVINRIELICADITDEGCKYLNQINDISLCLCDRLTDDAMQHLSHVKNLEILWLNITENGINHLKSLKELVIDDEFPVEAFEYLPHIDKLTVLGWRDPIPFSVAKHLKNLVELVENNGDCNFTQDEEQYEDSENKLFLHQNGVILSIL